MSTPEQHLALFEEIWAEMTPQQRAAAVLDAQKPLKLDLRLDFKLEVDEQEQALTGWLYRGLGTYQPSVVYTADLL